MISVKFDKGDINKVLNALKRIEQTVKVQGLDIMQFKCATDYYQLVMTNIMKRTIASPAYSKRYRNWKYEYGWQGYPSPWRLRGDLVKSLGAYRLGEGHIGGVQPGAMDSGGKSWFGKGQAGPKGPSKSIEMYGRVEENRRPIFAPSMREYEKNGYQKRGDEMLERIKADWK